MNVQTISVNIRYSCPMADGSYKTVELGAEGSLTPDEDYHEAQIALYHELGKTMKYVFNGNGSGKVTQAPAKKELPEPPAHFCQQHQTPFKQYTKEGRSWWGHQHGNGWCAEKSGDRNMTPKK